MAGEWNSAGTGAASGAVAGGTAGSAFGPVGTVIGAGVGAVVGGTAGYISGRGVAKREEAQQEALRKRQIAIQKYRQRLELLGSEQEHAGYDAARQSSNTQLQSAQDQMAFEGVKPMETQAALERSKGMAAAFAGDTGGATANTSALKSAAQQQYATNMASVLDARSAAAQLPGQYAAAQAKVTGDGMRIGDRSDIANAALGQQYGQLQQMHSIRQAEAQRDYASEMAQAGFADEAAKQAGSEQMMYGGMLNAGLNTGMGVASSYAQSNKTSAAQQEQLALQRQIADYYRQQMAQQNQYYNSRPTAGRGIV